MRYRSGAATLFLVSATACANEPTAAPQPGAIAVPVQTSGGEPYDNRMTLVVGQVARRPIAPHASVTVSSISPGAYTVALEDVAGNCSVTDPNPLSVSVPSGRTVDI